MNCKHLIPITFMTEQNRQSQDKVVATNHSENPSYAEKNEERIEKFVQNIEENAEENKQESESER